MFYFLFCLYGLFFWNLCGCYCGGYCGGGCIDFKEIVYMSKVENKIKKFRVFEVFVGIGV